MSSPGATAAPHPGAARIVAAARGWIGTPYRHQASLRGAGADCLGLVRGVYREVMGREPEAPPPYTADWAETAAHETLLAAAARHLHPLERDAIAVGDVLAFRWRADAPAKHLAIVAGADAAGRLAIIHAHEGLAVAEVPLVPAWARRIAAAYRFPPLPEG